MNYLKSIFDSLRIIGKSLFSLDVGVNQFICSSQEVKILKDVVLYSSNASPDPFSPLILSSTANLNQPQIRYIVKKEMNVIHIDEDASIKYFQQILQDKYSLKLFEICHFYALLRTSGLIGYISGDKIVLLQFEEFVSAR